MSTETLCHVWGLGPVVQGSIQLPQSRNLFFLFTLSSASLALHLPLAATKDISVSYGTLSLVLEQV